MNYQSDDEYTEPGTVRSIDPGYDPKKSFPRDPYKYRRPSTLQSKPSSGRFDGSPRPPRREDTDSQRGHSRPASVQSGRTGSTARPLPAKSQKSSRSRMDPREIRDFPPRTEEQSVRSYPTVRQTQPIRREGGSVYSQDPVQPRETMSAYSGSRQAQPVYGNNPRPDDPFGLPMNMGALALDDRSRYSAAPSSNHNRERGLVSQNDFQDRMPLANSTQQSMRPTRDDEASQAYALKQAIKNEIRTLTTASDRYINPKDAIQARGAQVIAEEQFTARMMGPKAYDKAVYGAPEIDFSQRPDPRPGLASTSASSNYGNQYYQPRLPAPREPGFIEAGPVQDDNFSVGSLGTSGRHSRHDSVSYDRAPPPRRAIRSSADRRFRDPRDDRFDELPPPRTRPPPSHTGSRQSETVRSGYSNSKHSSRADGSHRPSRREKRDEYDSD